MNRKDLWLAQILAKHYRSGRFSLKEFHDTCYGYLAAGSVTATAPEVWLTTVMQLAKS